MSKWYSIVDSLITARTKGNSKAKLVQLGMERGESQVSLLNRVVTVDNFEKEYPIKTLFNLCCIDLCVSLCSKRLRSSRAETHVLPVSWHSNWHLVFKILLNEMYILLIREPLSPTLKDYFKHNSNKLSNLFSSTIAYEKPKGEFFKNMMMVDWELDSTKL